MSTRPTLQKNHSSSSISQTTGKSPGNRSHVVGGGNKSRLSARVPSYGRNINKLGKAAPTSHAGQKVVLPRNTTKTSLRKNHSETTLHRRNRSSIGFGMTAIAQNEDDGSTTQRPGSARESPPDAENEYLETPAPELKSSRTGKLESTARPRSISFVDISPTHRQKSDAAARPSHAEKARRARDGLSNWEDSVAESFDFEAEKTLIERAARGKATEAPEETVLPLRPYTSLSTTGRITGDTRPPEVASNLTGHDIDVESQPSKSAAPTKDRRVKFTIGDAKADGEGDEMDNEADDEIPTPSGDFEQASIRQTENQRPTTPGKSGEKTSKSPASHRNSRQGKPSNVPPPTFNIQSNLDRDRIKTMQPEYALPPSAWKSHKLIEVTPHLTNPKSEYSAKFMNRWDREVDKKLENLMAIRDPLSESWDRIMRGTHILAEPNDAAAGPSVKEAESENIKKKPDQSTTSLAAWFGGRGAVSNTARAYQGERNHNAEEISAMDDENWLRDMYDTLDELDEFQPEYAAHFRSVLYEKYGSFADSDDMPVGPEGKVNTA